MPSRPVARGGAVAAAALLLFAPWSLAAQTAGIELTLDAPPVLSAVADRIRRIDRAPLALAIARAGLAVPPRVHVTLIAEDDPRARTTPAWIAGLAPGAHHVVLFPARIASAPAAYPYDSFESVFWHEVVHVALSAQAGDQPLPRWFHEGVAMSIERGWGVTSQVQLLLAAGATEGVADLGRLFRSDGGPQSASAYLLAALLVSDVRRRHDPAVPGAVATRVARGEPFASAFWRETGETPDEAAGRAWRLYRRWTN